MKGNQFSGMEEVKNKPTDTLKSVQEEKFKEIFIKNTQKR